MITNTLILAKLVVTLVTNTTENFPTRYESLPKPPGANPFTAEAYGHFVPIKDSTNKTVTTQCLEISTLSFEWLGVNREVRQQRELWSHSVKMVKCDHWHELGMKEEGVTGERPSEIWNGTNFTNAVPGLLIPSTTNIFYTNFQRIPNDFLTNFPPSTWNVENPITPPKVSFGLGTDYSVFDCRSNNVEIRFEFMEGIVSNRWFNQFMDRVKSNGNTQWREIMNLVNPSGITSNALPGRAVQSFTNIGPSLYKGVITSNNAATYGSATTIPSVFKRNKILTNIYPPGLVPIENLPAHP